jgi:hypothetical protein
MEPAPAVATALKTPAGTRRRSGRQGSKHVGPVESNRSTLQTLPK